MKTKIFKQLSLLLFIILPIIVLAQTPYQNKRGKWGYTLNDTKWIKPIYDSVTPFEKGIARVCLDGDWGVISNSLCSSSSKPNYIVWPQYNSISEFKPMYDGISYAIVTRYGNAGLIDNSGREILSLDEYSDIELLLNNKRHAVYKLQKKDSYLKAKKAGAIIVDKRKHTIENIRCNNEDLRIFNKKRGWCIITQNDGCYEILDKTGYCQYRGMKSDPTENFFYCKGRPYLMFEDDKGNTVYHHIGDGVGPMYYVSFDDQPNVFEQNNIYSTASVEKYPTYANTEYYEETINGNIYMHEKVRYSITKDDIEIHFLKHYIDKQTYIYLKKGEDIKKVLVKEIHDFLPTMPEHYLGRSLRTIQFLSNGDILLEIYGIIHRYSRDESIVLPPQYMMIQGQLVCIDPGGSPIIDWGETYEVDVVVLDGKTLKPKHTATLPNGRSVYGVSKLGGFYLGYKDAVSYGGDFIKYTNDCKPEWRYSLKEGSRIDTIYETTQDIYLLGSTTREGYIGRKNPMLICLDRQTGGFIKKHTDMIDSEDYSYTGIEHGIAYATCLSNIKLEDKRFSFFSLEKKEPISEYHTVVADYSYGIPACGLKDVYGKWSIRPVIPDKEYGVICAGGNIDDDYGSWIIYPSRVSKGKFDKRIVISKDGKYGLYDTETNSWIRRCNANTEQELYE